MTRNQEKKTVTELVDWLNKELNKMPVAFNELFSKYVKVPVETETMIVCGQVDPYTADFGVLGLINGIINAKVTPYYRVAAVYCPVSGLSYFDIYDVQAERSTGYGKPKD